MSPRTELAIEPGTGLAGGASGLMLKLAKAPVAYDSSWRPFNVDPNAMPPWSANGTPVRDYGRQILDRLCEHPGVKSALDAALLAGPGQRFPIYFRLKTDQLEQLHWEALCDAQGRFLALDRRWPVGRIADSDIHQDGRWHTFAPPLRVMAFASAAGEDAKAEFDALYGAIVAARAANLPTELEIYVGQEALHDSIAQRVANGSLQGVAVHPMLDRHAAMEDAILDYRPHILHFFGHGYAGHGVAQLEFATFADSMAGRQSGSTVLRIDDLRELVAQPDVDLWLVTLNCCVGAKAADGLPSMARSLVNAGAPAVVGMAEPIAAGDAHEFASNFYAAVLGHFAEKLAPAGAGAAIDIEWAELLHRARAALRSVGARQPEVNREWTLPVLYTRPEPFGVVLVPDVVREKVNLVAQLLRSLPPDTPPQTRQLILQRLPPGLPPRMVPDAFGNFP